MQTWSPSQPPATAQERPPYNTLAPISLALTFMTILGGIVCGHVALAQIHRTGERGAWLAVLALVIGYTVIGLSIGFFVLLLGSGLLAALQR